MDWLVSLLATQKIAQRLVWGQQSVRFVRSIVRSLLLVRSFTRLSLPAAVLHHHARAQGLVSVSVRVATREGE